jgi:hypothetical protein
MIEMFRGLSQFQPHFTLSERPAEELPAGRRRGFAPLKFRDD